MSTTEKENLRSILPNNLYDPDPSVRARTAKSITNVIWDRMSHLSIAAKTVGKNYLEFRPGVFQQISTENRSVSHDGNGNIITHNAGSDYFIDYTTFSHDVSIGIEEIVNVSYAIVDRMVEKTPSNLASKIDHLFMGMASCSKKIISFSEKLIEEAVINGSSVIIPHRLYNQHQGFIDSLPEEKISIMPHEYTYTSAFVFPRVTCGKIFVSKIISTLNDNADSPKTIYGWNFFVQVGMAIFSIDEISVLN